MPVTAELLAKAGVIESPSALSPGLRVWYTKDVIFTRQEINLRWLSDVWVLPRNGLFSAVFSVGDIFMMIGLFWLIQTGMIKEAEKTPDSTHYAVQRESEKNNKELVQ
jgi:hypothetical protein